MPGATESTNFTMLGWEEAVGDKAIGDLATAGFTARYDATTQTYMLDLPSTVESPFVPTSSSSAAIIGRTGADNLTHVFFLGEGATYTRAGSYVRDLANVGQFVFGVPTLASAIPVTGSANYQADLQGAMIGAIDGSYGIAGTAMFNFDFGAGSLSGSMSPTLIDGWGFEWALGTYVFADTIYSPGATSFSGSLVHASNGLTGSFLGLFTGPTASELMGRYELQFKDPYSGPDGHLYGVLVGRKDGGP